jgi:dienelactone hydrolase
MLRATFTLCRFRGQVVLLVSLLAVLAGCGDDGESSAAQPPIPTSRQLTEAGPYAVGSYDVALVDRSRPTQPNGTFPGLAERRLPTTVWYPSEANASGSPPAIAQRGGPFPLVIYAHGFLGNRRGGAYLARHLASHGYVVAAADFPLTSFSAPGGATLSDLANQPGDVSFLLDSLLAGAAEPREGFGLAQRLDRDALGVMGLSLGGATSLLVGFHPQLHDPRIRAVVAHAPLACLFGARFFSTRAVPLLLVHGDIDAIVPYPASGLRAYQRALPPKYLVTLLQGNHTSFTDGAETLFGQMSNADDLGCSALLSALSSGGSTDFTAGLGGPENGIELGGCPLPCALGSRNPPSMRPERQHELAVIATFAHFEAWLRRRSEMRVFLEQVLAAENPDAQVAFQAQ